MTNKQPEPPKIGDKIKVICNNFQMLEEVTGIYRGMREDNRALIEVNNDEVIEIGACRHWLVKLIKGKKYKLWKKTKIIPVFMTSISDWEVLERNKKGK